jgi:hypothetical protein
MLTVPTWPTQLLQLITTYPQAYGTFAAMVVVALLLGATPFGRPLKWAETFYHELSHGLAALLTFGKMVKLEIKWNGAGACYTQGGSRTLILLAGYAGASAWGALLFVAGTQLGAHGVGLWLQIELALMALVIVFWVRDVQTLAIMAMLAVTYAAALLLPSVSALPQLLQFMGVYVMLNAIRAPLVLIDGKHVGDGAALASRFKIVPEIIWVLLWFMFACWCLLLCAELVLPGLAALTPW